MTEIFSPNHYVWIIPLGCFALLIIAATCYFLRREIAAFFRKMFLPDTNRYILPASIISNINAEKEPSPKPNKKKSGFLRRFETNFRWHFRHIKHVFSKWFAEFANTEDSPSNAAKAEESTVKVMAERAENISPLIPPQKEGTKGTGEISLKEETKEEKPEINTPPLKESPFQEAEPSLLKTGVSAQSSPEFEQKNTPENPPVPQEDRPTKSVEEIPVAAANFKERGASFEQAPRKNFWNDLMSDRTAIILALLILAGFTIFLGARVKLLGSIVMRQRVEMRNMQKQIEMIRYEQNGFKIVIHERTILPQKRYNR